MSEQERGDKDKEKIVRIMGIDPGTNVMGYAIIDTKGSKVKLIAIGVIKTKLYNTHYDKLKQIFLKVNSLIKQYSPDEVALEAPFFGKNVQSMLKLGRAQGMAMAAALSNDKEIFEYAPLKIKQSVTGSGGSSKEQVAFFLKSIFKLDISKQELDATDALATAVCHNLQKSNPVTKSNGNDWSKFISDNSHRVSGDK